MHYIQIVEDSFRLFRTTKLVWVFGFFTILTLLTSLIPTRFLSGNPIFDGLYLIVLLPLSFISLVGSGSLIYVIHQAFLNKTSTFVEAWRQGRLKIFRTIGLLL